MRASNSWLFRIMVSTSVIGFALFALTMAEPQWIERLLGESPDNGDGSVERGIVGGALLVASLIAAVLAWRTRARRLNAGTSR